MRYKNELCCGCSEPLCPETDDVVVCPDCGAPMHRHCWQAAGGCPQAVQHGEGFAWHPTLHEDPEDQPLELGFDPQTQAGQICPNCGHNCSPGAKFCGSCGTDFEAAAQSFMEQIAQESLQREQQVRENFPSYMVNGRVVRMGDSVAGHAMEDICLQLRGSPGSVARYLARFESEKRLGWNWAAFLLGPFWLFLRKLYKPALLFAGIMLVLTLAFMTSNDALVHTVLEPHAQQVGQISMTDQEAVQAAAQEFFTNIQHWAWAFRWQLVAIGTLWLATRAVIAMLADSWLRRRIFGNIEQLREDDTGEADDESLATPGLRRVARRMNRRQTLMYLGGLSYAMPTLYLLALWILPGFILQIIESLIR